MGLGSRLKRRNHEDLPCFSQADELPKVLLDTTVYIDQFRSSLPSTLEDALDSRLVWHSTVTECELALVIGLLDPAHDGTASAVERVMESIDRRAGNRIVNPDRQDWQDAGILAGILSRLQQYGKADQRRALNDALIFLSAAKAGLTVLTRNSADYDLLMQLYPKGKVIFYEV